MKVNIQLCDNSNIYIRLFFRMETLTFNCYYPLEYVRRDSRTLIGQRNVN